MSERENRSMQGLLRKVRSCRLCELPLGPKPLLQATSTARILIAGQAPGRRAHESGVPFDDASGDRLRAWLGVDRDTFYDSNEIAIVPMGFCYPGTGKSGDLPPRAECADAWRDQLLVRMSGVKLTVLLGLYAQRWHLGEECGDTLTDNVSRWRQFWPHAVPLPHPSPRNARWLAKNKDVEITVLPAVRRRVKRLLSHR